MDERRDDQRIWEHEQKAIRKKLNTFDVLLRGDPEKDTDGLIARMHSAENDILLLKAAVFTDKAGNKGLQGRVDDLEAGEHSSDNRWKFATVIVSGLLGSGIVASQWAKIDAYLHPPPRTRLDRMIEKAKHPKGKIHYVIRPQQPQESEPKQTTEN